MNKQDKLIMVVRISDLFPDIFERDSIFKKEYHFQGFKLHNEINFESLILNNYGFMSRKFAEHDSGYKQPIAYTFIINSNLKKAFAYQRSSHDDRYLEKRLQGKWSWGVGGHIERSDTSNENPIHSSMIRELNEEIGITDSYNIQVLGYINDDNDDVGKVHFGVIYAVSTKVESIKPNDSEIAVGRLRSIDELEKICSTPEYNVENWSRISLQPLKAYLSEI